MLPPDLCGGGQGRDGPGLQAFQHGKVPLVANRSAAWHRALLPLTSRCNYKFDLFFSQVQKPRLRLLQEAHARRPRAR